MQSMAMTLSRRCMYAKLHVTWSKSLLYIFSLINHIDSLRIQALSLNPRHRTLVFLCLFALFTFTRETINSHYRKLERIIKKAKNIVMYIAICIANSEKDSRDRNRNWNDSDIHALTRQIQQSDKRLRQNNHNESETASY